MFTADVCIGHCDTFELLKLCLRCVMRHQNPLVHDRYIIVDQSTPPVFEKVKALCAELDPEGAKFVVTPAKVRNAGHTIDMGLVLASATYFCTLDADAFVTNRNWLYLPIYLIAHGHAAWVGIDTKLSWAYKRKGPFTHENNYYRVSETDLARRCAQAVSFLPWEGRHIVGFVPQDTSWEREPGPHNCDNGVVAMWYAERVLKAGPKLSLAQGGALGMTPHMGVFGHCYENMMIHLVFASSQPMNTLGEPYLKLRAEIDAGGVTPDDVLAWRSQLKGGSHYRELDGKAVSPELNALIEKLKAE